MKHLQTRLICQFLLVAALCLAGGLSLVAQAPKFELGPPLESAGQGMPHLKAADGESIYVQSGTGFSLAQYGDVYSVYDAKDHSVKALLNLNVNVPGYSAGKPIFTGPVKDKIFALTCHVSDDISKVSVYATVYDRQTCKLVKPATCVATFTGIGKAAYFLTEANLSQDSSQFVISSVEQIGKKDLPKLHVTGVSLEGKEQWGKVFELDLAAESGYMGQCILSKEGVLYMMKRGNLGKGQAAPMVEVMSYNTQTGQVQKAAIDTKGMHVDAANLTMDAQSRLWFAGFCYADEPKKGPTEGVFYAIVDAATMKVVRSEVKAIPALYATNASGKEKLPYLFKTAIVCQDGSFVLLGEQSYQEDMPTGKPMETPYQYTNNIAAVCLGKEGGVKWATKIAKRQFEAASSPTESGFLAFEYGGKVRLVFSDHPDNLGVVWSDKPVERVSIGHKWAVAVMVSIDASGKAVKSKIFDGPETGAVVRPGPVAFLAPNKVLFLTYGNERSRFGTLTF